jgi:hypothetical protein
MSLVSWSPWLRLYSWPRAKRERTVKQHWRNGTGTPLTTGALWKGIVASRRIAARRLSTAAARALVAIREAYVRLQPALSRCSLTEEPPTMERVQQNLANAIRIRQRECATAAAPTPRPAPTAPAPTARPPERCAVQGQSIPEMCTDETTGKNCKCLNITNKCGYTITISYKATGARAGSTDLADQATLTNVCTGSRSQSIQFLGYKRRP